MPRLLLFDIDGTLLLRAAGQHGASIRAAVARVHDLDEADVAAVEVETAGRTDPAIARSLARGCGVDDAAFDARLPDLVRAAEEEYAARCEDDLSATVAPGVAPLLEGLAARDDVLLSLVTGNLEAIARRKLDRAGIGRFFAPGQGGFGSDSEDRADLPGIARERAGGVAAAATVVIGDTPLDIACARAGGVGVVAVATGRYGPDELRDADHVVASAHALAVLL